MAGLRTLATDLLENLPGAYCSVMRPRHPEWFLVERDTDLVLEGYQSCGNTFARKAMELANPGTRIASHSHSSANVAHGLRLGKPVVVLLRPPLDAIASHTVRMRLDNLHRELARYRRFYRRVLAMADRVVLSPFDVTVGRFGAVIETVNGRCKAAFKPFDHTDPAARARIFEEMELEALSSPTELDRMWRIARPNAERAAATAEVRGRLRGPSYAGALTACEALHVELLQKGTLSH